MEPRVQYAKTSDGVSIAFWTLGEGAPLVILPSLVSSHLQMEWEQQGLRAFYGGLAERARVIRYDCRGLGMSQRDAIDFSVEAAARDLEAVADRLGLERFAISGPTPAGGIRFAYAARHPEWVSHLVLPATRLYRRSLELGRQFDALEPLLEREWELYVEIYSRLLHGWESPGAAPFAARTRAIHSAQSFRLALKALDESSPAAFLAAIQAPTLILHRLGNQEDGDSARALATGIANARVLGIPGLTVASYQSEAAIAAVLDFINTEPAAPGLPIAAPQIDASAVRTILWTDIEGHTSLMDRLGDAKGRELLREHERLTREALASHGGAEVKAMGDGFMAWFPSAQRALECAIALQRAFEAHGQTGKEPLRVRAGVNAGEPIAEEDDLFGASVIAAARICKHAGGGQIVASDVVRQLVAGKGFLFAERGEVALRGFEDPVRLYEVRWREERGTSGTVD